LRSQPERTNDLWLLGFDFLLDTAETVLLPERYDEISKLLVVDAGSQVAVESVTHGYSI